ncbi:hypothetical protein QCA50_009693 [Cerrena zonata]|uniref:Inosine/uridine-preferring nucleoside hydrolase domain-containing protein n=1 Tax=Cerrena zonata TaxID=2478898 RepID=A0AAW0GAJ7_9APHY
MSPAPVIIDTDPGVDDVLALLLALASPELEIIAIIVTYGNTDADASYVNILKVYDNLSRHFAQYPEDQKHWPNFAVLKKTILARGAVGPLAGEPHTAQYFHGRDGLGDITNRYPSLNLHKDALSQSDHPQLQFTEKSGVDVALDLVSSHPSGSITYIALGPLTTLAQVAQKGDGMFAERIGKVVCMGGNLDVPGNTTPVAEFNFFADPYAVHAVLPPPSSAPAPVPLEKFILVPLDITTQHELPFPSYVQHVDPSFPPPTPEPLQPLEEGVKRSPIVYFTSAFLSRTREVMLKFGKDVMELHDIAAVWYAIENPPNLNDPLKTGEGWELVRREFQIERTGELTRGMLIIDRRNDSGAYAPGANRARVQAELERLNAQTKGAFESTALPAQVEVETESQADSPSNHTGSSGNGVPVVTRTPGGDVLLKLLMKRVWGVGRSS